MEKYLVSAEQLVQNPKPKLSNPWKRFLVELNGRSEPKYCREMSGLWMKSFSQVGVFPHLYHINGATCLTHLEQSFSGLLDQTALGKQGVSYLDFDSKGIYLASVTQSGCLTVHDYESLYCKSNVFMPCLIEDESLNDDEDKHLLHLFIQSSLNAVKWNPTNQNEVACTRSRSSDVLIYDISYISSHPTEILRGRRTVSIHGSAISRGLSDIAFTSDAHSRLLACDVTGAVNVWDRRTGDLPCLELVTNSQYTLTSVQVDVENQWLAALSMLEGLVGIQQIVFAAGKLGIVYMWDLRGGRSCVSFQGSKGESLLPFTSLRIASLLENIESLKAQSDIVSKEVHSIAFDPSSPYQLAFHLDDGWSGVLNTHNLQVTHIHCPPPAWLDDSNTLNNLRKPSWSSSSIFAVGSSSSNGIHLLDFYPDLSSPCHVYYNEDIGVKKRKHQNRFVNLSSRATACATHPLNGDIIVGTKDSSLLLVSQRHPSYQGDEEDK